MWFRKKDNLLQSQNLDQLDHRVLIKRNFFNKVIVIITAEFIVSNIIWYLFGYNKGVTYGAVIIFNVIIVLFLFLFFKHFYSEVSKSLSNIILTIKKYQEGDTSARAPVISKGELGYMELKFNEIISYAEHSLSDFRKIDEMKSDFISTVSHELRTPLTSIRGYTKLLLSEDTGDLSNTQKEFLGIVDTNVVRLNQLINDLLDIEKIESGKIQILKESENLSEILTECRDTFKVSAKEKGLGFIFKNENKEIRIRGDKGRLVQIFMNLLSNAIKYTDSGYVELTVDLHDFAVVVRVKDTGVGVNEEDRKKLFQKFYRAKVALSKSDSGTGLGLSIARGLIEAHGGMISIDNEYKEGTCFIVSLPTEKMDIALEEGRRLKGEISELKNIHHSGRFWFVNYKEHDFEKISRMLSGIHTLNPIFKYEFKFIDAIGDIKKVSSLSKHSNIIILDTDDLEDLKESLAKAEKVFNRSFSLLLTTTNIGLVDALDLGVDSVLKKPVQQKELVETIASLLWKRSWKALLVEPHHDIRLLMKRSIEKKGIKVDDVENGNTVLDRLTKENYDLLILSLNVPGVPASELVVAIRHSQELKNIPVFVLAEDSDFLQKEKSFQNMVNGRFSRHDEVETISENIYLFLANKKNEKQK